MLYNHFTSKLCVLVKNVDCLADAFEKEWNFLNCVGARDGKHVHVEAPPGSNSSYYDYKHFQGMILLDFCDAK